MAMSPSTPVRITLEILGSLAWRDLAEASIRAELAPAVRQKAESLLLDSLRTLRLGDLVSLSLLGPRRVARALLSHGDDRVRAGALQNPRLRSLDVCEEVERASAPPDLSGQVLLCHRWALLYDVRLSIVRGTATPRPVALPLVSTLNPGDLREIAGSDAVSPLIAAVARRLLG